MAVGTHTNDSRRTALTGLIAAFGAGALSLAAAPAGAASLNAVQYFYSTSFASGSQSDINATITPVTATGMVFVIQTVSIYRYPPSTSTLQSFIAVTYGGKTGYFTVPDIPGTTTDFYPATTANLTAYVTAGTHAYMNLYRTGGSYPAETDYITVSGYITPGS